MASGVSKHPHCGCACCRCVQPSGTVSRAGRTGSLGPCGVLRASGVVSTDRPQTWTHSSVQWHSQEEISTHSSASLEHGGSGYRCSRREGNRQYKVLCPQWRGLTPFLLKVLFALPKSFDGYKSFCLMFSWLDVCCTCISPF